MLIRTFADVQTLIEAGEISDAEQALIRNSREGVPTILGDGKTPEEPSKERSIRPDLLRYLILGGCDNCRVHETGVRLRGAWVPGSLDLNFTRAKGVTQFWSCSFGQAIDARQAQFVELSLSNCHLRGLSAQGLVVAGSVFLGGLTSTGMMDFNSSQIGGQLHCEESTLEGAELEEPTAEGATREKALNAQGARIGDSLFLRGLKSTGTVDINSAQIGGQLSFEDAELDGIGGVALKAYSARTMGGVFLNRMKSKGEVCLSGAEIGGQLACLDAELDGGDDYALNGQRLVVKEGVFLRGVKSAGEVSFSGAEIGGQLDCEGAELDVGGGKALNAEGVRVAGHVLLRRLTSTGEVRLSGAEIGGQLVCGDAELDGGDGMALNAQRLVVKEGFFWRQVKSVKGAVELAAAHLGDLVDDAASWDKVADVSLVDLTYDNLAGPLDLEMRKAWLKKGAQFGGSFHPQPYQQLAKVFRETGHRREARKILIAKEIEQRRAARENLLKGRAGPLGKLNGAGRFSLSWAWDFFSRRIAGYGYKPWRSIYPLLTLVAAMTLLSLATWRSGDFAPNSDVILTSPDWTILAENTSLTNPAQRWADKHGPGQDYETFAALAYGFDVVVPILNLGQTDAWAPSTSRSRVGWWVFYLEKIFVILGWGVTAIVATAVTGMIRRDD